MSLIKKIKKVFKKTKPEKPQVVAEKTNQKKEEIKKKETSSKPKYHKNKRTNYRNNNPKKPKSEQHKPSIPEEKRVPFKDLGLNPELLEVLTKNNFIEATKIQSDSIPISLKGQNMFCSSQTGSGKTLAFLLPMLHKLLAKEISQALIICPTREIAIQTLKVLQMFQDLGNFKSALVVGGTDMWVQKETLREYPEILVATPGRLLDMINNGLIWLQYTGYVVLDEADRMLDMGFEKELVEILKELTGKHQTLLFSATLFPEIMKLANQYVKDYHQIKVGSPSSIAKSVDHYLIDVEPGKKMQALKKLIHNNKGKIIVFFNTINEADRTYRSLKKFRINRIDCLHSRRDQQTREAIVSEFRSGKIKILLASDVAARGIDIPNVELVVNFDLPKNAEEYIHRVGRTGRAGLRGKSVSLYSCNDRKTLTNIEKLIKSKIRRQPPKQNHDYKNRKVS